jgi:hypothetical protein
MAAPNTSCLRTAARCKPTLQKCAWPFFQEVELQRPNRGQRVRFIGEHVECSVIVTNQLEKLEERQ